VKLEAEDVVLCGSLVFIGVCQQLVPDVKRILLTLPPLLGKGLRSAY
jgi:hypothetical protein